jgi:ABC-2 type transport system permease protein
MASNERTGEVFDLGYQHYDGLREGRSRARKAMYSNGLRTVLGIGRGPKAKIVPLLLFVSAMIPAVVMAVMVSVLGPLADDLPGAGDYYDIISLLLFIFGAIMAPELISPDRKDRVLDLYLVRPISIGDYVTARLLAFFTVIFLLAISGQLLLQIALILSAASPVDYLRDNWLDTPRFLAGGVLIAAYITVIPMAVAAFTTRRAYASAFVIGLFMITYIMSNGLTFEECQTRVTTRNGEVVTDHNCEAVTGEAAKWFALISFRDIPLRMSDMIFDRISEEPSALAAAELNDMIPIGMYVLFTIGPVGLMWWQYRRTKL